MPRGLKDTKIHEVLNFSRIYLVNLCVLAPWWRKTFFYGYNTLVK